MEKYKIIKKIGKGNFGNVLLAERIHDQKLFAMKQVDSINEYPNIEANKEAKLLESLDHPNIIKCYESFYDKQNLCIILEYAENGDLLNKIQKAKSSGEYIQECLIMEWFTQLCLAVKYLHDRKILHRDIKLQNTFLTKSGLIKLGDFGISKQLTNTYDFAQSQVGTPFYLSPEMCFTSIHTHKSDIWMLGCLLYELCSLKKPFPGDALHVLVKKITKEKPSDIPSHFSIFIKTLINKLLEKNPDDRPSINKILEYQEIIKEVEKLKGKYEDVYKDLSLISTEKCSPMIEPINLISINNNDGYEAFLQAGFIDNLINTPLKAGSRNQEEQKTDKSHLEINKERQALQSHVGVKDIAKTSARLDYDNSSNVKRRKISQNSISSLLQQKARLTRSPAGFDYSTYTLPSPGQNNASICALSKGESFETSSSMENMPLLSLQLIKPSKVIVENEEDNISSPKNVMQADISFSSIINFININSSSMTINHTSESTNVDEEKLIPSCTEDNGLFSIKNTAEPRRSYFRDIQIKTEGLERVHPQLNVSLNVQDNKERPNIANSSFKSPINKNNDQGSGIINESNHKISTPNSSLPTAKVTQNKKVFSFSEKLFDYRSPTSQDRSYWFCQFLIKKLGYERFEKVKLLLENSPNPLQIIDEQKSILFEILGDENRDCIRILRCLISSAVTPTSDTNKSESDLEALNTASSTKSINESIDSSSEDKNNGKTAFSFDKIIKSPLNSNKLTSDSRYGVVSSARIIPQSQNHYTFNNYGHNKDEQKICSNQSFSINKTPEKSPSTQINLSTIGISKNLNFETEFRMTARQEAHN